MRRYKELLEKSEQSIKAVAADMKKRDENDAARDVAPLKPAADALILDSTELSVEAVVREMMIRVSEKARA